MTVQTSDHDPLDSRSTMTDNGASRRDIPLDPVRTVFALGQFDEQGVWIPLVVIEEMVTEWELETTLEGKLRALHEEMDAIHDSLERLPDIIRLRWLQEKAGELETELARQELHVWCEAMFCPKCGPGGTMFRRHQFESGEVWQRFLDEHERYHAGHGT